MYISHQIAAQNHGMLGDLMDTVTALKERYREAWLEESTAYRLGSALARWDAETEYWRAMQVRAAQIVRERKKDEPFPPLDALRPKR